jgi:hypothetical protein
MINVMERHYASVVLNGHVIVCHTLYAVIRVDKNKIPTALI